MPTRRASELLVPRTTLSTPEWNSLIEEWVKLLGPVFKSSRFHKLGELKLDCHIESLAKQLSYDGVNHNLPLETEGIWFYNRHRPQIRRIDFDILGLDRKSKWYKGVVAIQTSSDGHRVSYRTAYAAISESSLEAITVGIEPEQVLSEIRDRIATFQEKARDKQKHYDHYGNLLDQDLMLLREAGIKI